MENLTRNEKCTHGGAERGKKRVDQNCLHYLGIRLFCVISWDQIRLFCVLSGDQIRLFCVLSGDQIRLFCVLSGDQIRLFCVLSGDQIRLFCVTTCVMCAIFLLVPDSDFFSCSCV